MNVGGPLPSQFSVGKDRSLTRTYAAKFVRKGQTKFRLSEFIKYIALLSNFLPYLLHHQFYKRRWEKETLATLLVHMYKSNFGSCLSFPFDKFISSPQEPQTNLWLVRIWESKSSKSISFAQYVSTFPTQSVSLGPRGYNRCKNRKLRSCNK